MRETVEFRARTKAYAAGGVRLDVSLERGRYEVQMLGKQILCAITSVAANDRKACRSSSRADFIAKIAIYITMSANS